MDWLIALGGFFALLALLPAVLRRTRKSASKGAAGGIVMGLGLAFMTLFDPAKSDAVEQIRRKRDMETEEDEEGEGPPAR